MIWQPSNTPEDVLIHSAKGSNWKKHKYLKKIGNTYVYAKKSLGAAKKLYESKDNYAIMRGETATHLANANDSSLSKDQRDYNRQKADEYAKIFLKDTKERKGLEKLKKTYANVAKRELASIPKEMLSDGKKLFDSLFKKK